MTMHITQDQIGAANRPRLVNKAIVSPLDVCTIVSLYPKTIIDRKETIFPNEFKVEGGSIDRPGITHVVPSIATLDLDEARPLQQIAIGSPQLAESIVVDYCKSLPEVQIGVAQPGVFFVLGKHDVIYILKNHKDDLKKFESYQKEWYMRLINKADAEWARGNGNPLLVWDGARDAAKAMGMMDKPWMSNQRQFAMTPCFACGAPKNPEYPICGSCRTIDPNHPKAKDLTQAK